MLFSSLTTSILPALLLVLALTTSIAFSAPSASATVTPPSRYYLTQILRRWRRPFRQGESLRQRLSYGFVLITLSCLSGMEKAAANLSLGAGTNDVTLKGVANASIGFLNGTY